MAWMWLGLSCLAVALVVNSLIHRFWFALPVVCVAGPLLFLASGRLLTGEADALDGLVLFFGQAVAIPVAVIVGAGFRAYRS